MLHARRDYMRFQDPVPVTLGGIPDQEPVMLFRAQDKHALKALDAYLRAIVDNPEVTAEHIRAVRDQIARFQRWGEDHGTKTPDMPEGARGVAVTTGPGSKAAVDEQHVDVPPAGPQANAVVVDGPVTPKQAEEMRREYEYWLAVAKLLGCEVVEWDHLSSCTMRTQINDDELLVDEQVMTCVNRALYHVAKTATNTGLTKYKIEEMRVFPPGDEKSEEDG